MEDKVKEKQMRFIENSEELGRNLREARESKNLTQQKVADILNVERSAISYYESGKSLPSILQLIKLSKQLKIRLMFFLTVDRYKASS